MGETSEPLADVIARLNLRLQPHAQTSPVVATRKATDTQIPVNGGTSDDTGSALAGMALLPRSRRRRRNTNASQRLGGRSAHYREPIMSDNPVPRTARVSASDMQRTASGIRITGQTVREYQHAHRIARANGVSNGYQAWVRTRANLIEATGDVVPLGEHYPNGFTLRGNLGEHAPATYPTVKP